MKLDPPIKYGYLKVIAILIEAIDEHHETTLPRIPEIINDHHKYNEKIGLLINDLFDYVKDNT
jgi:hypothetical protein